MLWSTGLKRHMIPRLPTVMRCLVTALALIAFPRTGIAQLVVYEVLPDSFLEHVHFGERGERQYVQVELEGTLLVLFKHWPEGDGIQLAIWDVDLRSVSDPVYEATGFGVFNLSALPSGDPGTDVAWMELRINQFENVMLVTSHPQEGQDTFPGIRFSVVSGLLDAHELFGLSIRALPSEEHLPLFFHRGDLDGDGDTNITDPIALLRLLFGGGGAPGCLDAADSNDDGKLDVADPVFLLSSLFLGTGRPPIPSSLCGLDPTEDDLNCQGQPGCMIRP